MILTRRLMMTGTLSGLVLAGCARGGGATLTVEAQGVEGMNPGPDGNDRPLILQIVQMSGAGAFDSADFFALQNPQSALGSEFISVQQLLVSPDAPQSVTVPISPAATAVGIVAGFRDPAGKNFRTKTAAPSRRGKISVAVDANGLSLQ